MNPGWKDEAWCPEKQQLYKKNKQTTMESWLRKTQITTTPKQPQDTRSIHPKQRKEMQFARRKLQARWEIRNNAIHEHAQQREMDKKGDTEYAKTAEKTEIAHLLASRPEIPTELELNREGRKQLEELMLEYPTKKDDQEEETMEEEEEQKQRRYYTCVRRKKPFKTQIGGDESPQTLARTPASTTSRNLREQMTRVQPILQRTSRTQSTQTVYEQNRAGAR